MKRARAVPDTPGTLQVGVAALAGIEGLDLLDGPTWDATWERWVLLCRITVPAGTDPRVPQRTTWYVLVDDAYPAGRITVYPANVGGISDTFHHQNRNSPPLPGGHWRRGDICVHEGARALGRLGGSIEPLDASGRLAWRLERAIAWVRAASTASLTGPGDPYELPDFATFTNEGVFGFSEDAVSFQIWSAAPATMGLADMSTDSAPSTASSRTVVRAYRDLQGHVVHEPRWGNAFEPSGPNGLAVGLWVRLPEVPYVAPWKAPETWGELAECTTAVGIDLDDLVAAASVYLRAAGRSWLLCGFPMPSRVGEPNIEYFWQALRLPGLAKPNAVLNGFRNTEKNRRFIDRLTRFRPDAPLVWVRSENWHPATRSARGRFSNALTARRVILIGGGALGSVVAELLVRGGLESLTVCDGQTTLAGNLVRHTLTLQEVGTDKAIALAARLNQASPHARVEALCRPFPPTTADDVALVRDADLVIDCTAEDEVALALAMFDWSRKPTFWSIALDWQARRCFSFLARGDRFPADVFLRAVREQQDADPATLVGRELAREGVGCWHPVMPARIDHVWMLASVAVGHLDDALETGAELDQLVIFERDDAKPSAGVRRV